jgi:hypothetical protein
MLNSSEKSKIFGGEEKTSSRKKMGRGRQTWDSNNDYHNYDDYDT